MSRFRVSLAGGPWTWVGSGTVATPPAALAYDFSDDNVPWAYPTDLTAREELFTQEWPSGVNIVDLQTGGVDFWDNLSGTVASAGSRVVVRIPAGVHQLTSFRMIGPSGDPTYSFGFWFPNLQGFLSSGADECAVEMAADSMSTAQLTALGQMDRASFSPNQMGLCRLDGTTESPILLAGLTFRAADQQMLTTKAEDLPVFIPQPAPHNGVVMYAESPAQLSHVRFQAAGRAINSRPPFEHSNIGSQYGTIVYRNCEFDGRRSPDLDPAMPRRCSTLGLNNEVRHELYRCHGHHSNVSRYAANDENRPTQGIYIVTECKFDHITDQQNTDPALNGGASLGGWTNATPFGWESCNGTITVTDCIVSQDNTSSAGQVPMMFQLTSVGERNPQGGRMYVNGGEYRNPGFPSVDGFVGFRILPSTYWWIDGFDTTLFVYHRGGQRLTPYVVEGTWPPTAQSLTNAGITTTSHYLIRST